MDRLLDKIYGRESKNRNKVEALSIVEEMKKTYYQSEQKRMDFLARVSTRWPEWGVSVDYFNEILLPFFANIMVWQFLNISDNINAERTKVEPFIFDKDSDRLIKLEIQNKEGREYNNLLELGIDFARGALNENEYPQLRKVIPKCEIRPVKYQNRLMWIRNGRIGAEAFYVLLEGVIRNAVKHRKNKSSEDILEVKIALFEKFQQVKKYVDFEEGGMSEDARKYYFCVVSCNFDKKKENLLEVISNHLNEVVIDDLGEIAGTAWGMKEIKIAANYLANNPLEKVDYKVPDYIAAGYTVVDGGNQIWPDNTPRLAFVFKIPRPKYALIISDKGIIEEPIREKLEQFGIKIEKTEDDLEDFQKKIKEISDVGYYFLVLDSSLESIRSSIKDIDIKLPKRQIFCETADLLRELKSLDDEGQLHEAVENIVLELYENWTEKFCGSSELDINIWFDLPTKQSEWEKANINGNVNFEDDLKKPSTIIIGRHWSLDEVVGNFYDEELKGVKYIECTSYSSSFFSFLYSINPRNNEFLAEFVLRQIWEMGHTSVVILDERVADSLSERTGQMEELSWMGISIINRVSINGEAVWESKNNHGQCLRMNFCNGEVEILKREPGKPGNWKNLEKGVADLHHEFTGKTKTGFDFLFIHQTRFNELFGSQAMKSMLIEKVEGDNDKVKKESFANMFTKKFRWLVIHSGRGHMEGDLPKNSSFLEFSVLQDNIIREPNKFGLVQAAFAAF